MLRGKGIFGDVLGVFVCISFLADSLCDMYAVLGVMSGNNIAIHGLVRGDRHLSFVIRHLNSVGRVPKYLWKGKFKGLTNCLFEIFCEVDFERYQNDENSVNK